MRAVLLAAAAAPACVPADEAQATGSVEFTFEASQRTMLGLSSQETDRIAVEFERVVLGFKTMTIGKVGVPDICAYRGRGAVSDVVFDPRVGLVQSFNGIQPVECPDVGVIFGPPGAATTLGEGVPSSYLVELATGRRPAHALIDATATWVTRSSAGTQTRTLAIKLRFDSERTSTRFGGCRTAVRGVRILPAERASVSVRFAAENLFRDAISTTSELRVRPFFDADEAGDGDGVVTMEELDALPLSRLFYGFYQLPDGSRRGSFGDFVRALFRFTIMFRTEEGICVGNDPGADEE